ncbi:MAG: YaiI/YqxD family protein [Lentisphaeria bacterium]|nr:YaiI/YqxD family protein [Lentisphaeria bacterium]
MKIYVDADACPKVIKEVLYKVSQRLEVPLLLVADQRFKIPESLLIEFLTVPVGIDAADEEIVRLATADDIVITADIPLADEIVTKGAIAINPRGEMYTPQNIKSRLAVRDIMAEIRGTGEATGGPPAFNDKDKENFTNQLDRLLTKKIRKRNL